MRIYIYFFLAFSLWACDNSNQRESLLNDAQKKYDNRKYELALEIYNSLLSNEQDADILLMRAKTKFELEDYIGTIEDCTDGLLIKKSVKFYSLRGASFEKRSNYDRAILDYDTCLTMNSKLEKIFNNRGMAHFVQGDLNKAMLDFDSAINLNNNIAIFYNNKGLVYENLENYEQAVFFYDKSIKLDSDYFATYFNRGVSYIYLKKYKEAVEDFNLVEKTYLNEFGVVYHNKAICYQSMHDSSLACTNWKLAIDLGNEDALYYYNKLCVK